MHGVHWIAHVIVDVCAMGAIVALVLWGGLPSSTGATLVVAVQAAYVVQLRRGGPPVGAVLGCAFVALEAIRMRV